MAEKVNIEWFIVAWRVRFATMLYIEWTLEYEWQRANGCARVKDEVFTLLHVQSYMGPLAYSLAEKDEADRWSPVRVIPVL